MLHVPLLYALHVQRIYILHEEGCRLQTLKK